MKNFFVISIGGSLIVPEEIDTQYLKNISDLIKKQIKIGQKFILSPGGGKTCRKYQAALSQVIKPAKEDLDWIGLTTNKLHAQLLYLIFKKNAHKNIAFDPNKKLKLKEKILIGAGGWKPGRSSDDFSVRLAKIYGAKTVINLSNIDFVYDKDPKKFKDAQKITNISWHNFFKIIGHNWIPGKNVPFDPTAAKFAQTNGIQVIIANGKNLENLKNILQGKKFIGTVVE